ncbi:MAG: hypothetical protein ACOH2N_14935 [Devosia sp.]
MSALTADGLFRLEDQVRSEADRIRFRNPDADLTSSAVSADAKIHIGNERARADDFDQIGNLLAGLQSDWGALGPMVRAGFIKQRAEYEAIKDSPETPAEDAA